uniref:Type VI secretion system component TssM1 N-terminal domain-containing protein n=1 Tax=Geobacter sp. (strain M21) TaxID=443144 RepID=C6E3K1_GEOSM
MKKETILVCCKYVLFAAAFVPFLVIAFVMFPLLTWSWRIGAFFPFFVLALWGILALIKKAVLLVRGRRQAPAAVNPPQPSEEGEARDPLADLQRHWAGGLETLRRSHLSQEGDPLYVLPWFLVLGETGSGKSAALKDARLCSPFPETEHGAAPTSSCRWVFYDQGVLIDTAGRYAVPVAAERDDAEWRRLLWLLKKHRHVDPLNGVILTLPADKLARGAREELENYARALRARLDEMIRLLGINFPVYLLITKSDLIEGMEPFCVALPASTLDQPMGLAKEELSTDLSLFMERFSLGLDEALRRLRLILLQQRAPGAGAASFLLFPDRIRGLYAPLNAFVQAAFGANHYQETPLLRGIYFCSADPAKTPLAPGEPSSSAHPLFLHEFFEKVLPGDRGLWAPGAQALKRQRAVLNWALAGWGLTGLALCLMLSYSFAKNIRVIRDASQLVSRAQELQGTVPIDLPAMGRLSGMISEVEQRNREWWIPRFGLDRSKEIELELKARFCSGFRDRFLVFFDRSLADTVSSFSPSTPDQLFGTCVMHLSRRCNLLKARLEGENSRALASRPLPDYPLILLHQQAGGPDFGNLYLDYLNWRADREGINKELEWLQLLLKQAYAVKGSDLSWLLEFVDRLHPEAAITLQQFWAGSRPLPQEPAIPPSLTAKGSERIRAMLAQIAAAHPEPGLLAREKGEFEARYRAACFTAWQRFAWDFPKGDQRLVAPKEWRYAAANMASDKGPYLSFMRRALAELQPLAGAGHLPAWVMQMYRFQLLRAAGPAAGVASSAAPAAEGVANRLQKLATGKGSGPDGVPGADVTREYLDALARVAPVAKSRSLALQMAREAFADSQEQNKSPLFIAADAAQRLNALLVQADGDDTFLRLVSGPIAFYGTFVRMETACELQAQWEEKVLKEVQGANDAQTLQYLLGKDGPVWRYVGQFADPFLGWSPGRGYYARSALGGAVPFSTEFYAFLAKGAKTKIAASAPTRGSYQVTIKGLPTDANAEARVKPQGTRLELQCAAGSQVISNMNYPVSRPFAWSPDSCGDVLFHIEIGDTLLTRRYPGTRGFVAFLRDFPGGRHTFYPSHFPAERDALEKMGVRFIRVNYQIFGAGDIPEGEGETLPGRVPRKVAECWD